MNEETKKAIINKFLLDEAMSATIYAVIRNSFLRSKGQRDVQVLAAERLAIDFFDDAWRELNRFKNNENDTAPSSGNVGL